ncbi:hypothetical protein [Nonomuraea typhae]|uniref:hypothetical protein n=1 Tax=Nonomuraea typhae TaxID=2603600 RepID=UPI0012F7ACD7|nr:hypothetical protein [Nonomuraea typhae]
MSDHAELAICLTVIGVVMDLAMFAAFIAISLLHYGSAGSACLYMLYSAMFITFAVVVWEWRVKNLLPERITDAGH